MGALPRLGVVLKIGFFALALGGLIVACGSISVIEEESLDGSTGSGGGNANSGSGGRKAGGTGGSNSGTGGGHGGAGGSNSGTGGTILTGVGGTVLTGLGGTGGRLGTGGSGGLGGMTGLGGQGASTGLGGGGGLGGQGASTGLGGGGGGGATGTSCAQLQRDFAVALIEAKTCSVQFSSCPGITNDRIECGCPTSVTSTVKVEGIRASYYQAGCATGVCSGVLCGYVSGGICTQGSGTAMTCVDQLSGPGPV
jgi:hypothetical protein